MQSLIIKSKSIMLLISTILVAKETVPFKEINHQHHLQRTSGERRTLFQNTIHRRIEAKSKRKQRLVELLENQQAAGGEERWVLLNERSSENKMIEKGIRVDVNP
ncbi:unnamed protein product [Paramecium octaurelia]|uniref:Uncharacterized protein n=1 Tax=Paramecium octaurelia TaxID=43137 RepID=A0A8S1YJH7_PAROT|nr:unnamed protein product [Paramecium octaurelia]